MFDNKRIGLGTKVAAGLLSLIAGIVPYAVHAQPCAGTAVTGSGTVTCEDGVTVIERTSGSGDNTASGGDDIVVNMTVVPNPGPFDYHDFSQVTFDFTGMSNIGEVNIINEAVWRVENMATTVPDGNFDIFVRSNGGLSVGLDPGSTIFAPFPGPFVIDFEGTDRVLVNEGYFAVGPRLQQSEVRLHGLAQFRHSGRILMGSDNSGLDITSTPHQFIANTFGGGFNIVRTDARTDDVLAIPDALWVGEGGEIWMDVNLAGGQSQTSCARDGGTGNLPAADCLELHGATTSGVTYLVLADPLAFDRGRFVPGQEVVLVDVTGGESAQGHFVVGPRQPGYSPLFGGSWDRGLFHYAVAYNADVQSHTLVGMLNGTAHQQAQLGVVAHDLWRLSTATSLNRQADLRDRNPEEGGGLWLRFADGTADREVTNIEQAGGRDWTFDNGRTQDSYAVTMGLDLFLGNNEDSAWVAGAMAGYNNADVEYDVSPNTAEINGWTLGVYGSYAAGPLWLDATVNVNDATVRQHIPGFNLNPPDTLVSNDLRSIGGQVDAGWRLDLTPTIFAEPLASVSYVRTNFDDLTIEPNDSSRPGLTVYWSDPTSLRAGLGGRLGVNRHLGDIRTQFSLTAKVWNESDGESIASIHNDAFPDDPDFHLKDEFDDTVTEVGVGASVRSPANKFSGFLNLGGEYASDYDAFTAKLGVRYQW